jgi:hypothetical protein
MSQVNYRITKLRDTLFSKKIATINELKEVLATKSTMTVFRALSSSGYLTSYSHRGSYYTLLGIPEFDGAGLWSFNSVMFSRHGNLLNSVAALIEQSKGGCSAAELDASLHVETKHAALRLLRQGKLMRSVSDGVFVYWAKDAAVQRRQLLTRGGGKALPAHTTSIDADCQDDGVKAAVILFFSLLDEKQRRLYAGLESSRLGYGGDRRLADLLGIDPHTVAKGRRELLGGTVDHARIRAKGGGRPSVEKKSPE